MRQSYIDVQHVTRAFVAAEGRRLALDDVSLSVAEGECVVIGGENGSGKSLLMAIIAGLERPDSGAVSCAARVGLVFQEVDTQILGETPREDIAFGPKNQKKPEAEIAAAVERALRQTGLHAKADYPARFLSGGEKRRLAVACMLAMDLPAIIFDEPYANLDYGGVRQVNRLLRRLREEGRTVLILTHELEKCLGMADRLIVLFRGRKVFDGSPEDGLRQDLARWNIRNPLAAYSSVKDLIW